MSRPAPRIPVTRISSPQSDPLAPILPDEGNADPTPYVTPAEQAMAAVRQRAAERQARRSSDSPTGDRATRGPGNTGAKLRHLVLRCPSCGRLQPRPFEGVQALAAAGLPMCCGAIMTPAPERESAVEPSRVPLADPPPERRAGQRRPPRLGTRVEVRRGHLGMGPDVALSVVDVSESGTRLRLKVPVRPGDHVEVALWPPGGGRSIRVPARVIWCRGDANGAVQVGVRLRRRLVPRDLFELTE